MVTYLRLYITAWISTCETSVVGKCIVRCSLYDTVCMYRVRQQSMVTYLRLYLSLI